MDKYTEVKHQSFGSRIVGAVSGVLIGLVVFAGSFYLIYWNEGRKDMSTIAKTSVEVDAMNPRVGQAANGQLVSATGKLTSGEIIGDGKFLKPGNYIAVQRCVEMFAWKERKEEKESKNTGGSSTKTTTYTYNRVWTRSPKSSSSFKRPEGHYNPPKEIDDIEVRVQNAKVGAFGFDMPAIKLPSFNNLPLSTENTVMKGRAALASSSYIFYGAGSDTAPSIGDLRISYKIVDPGRTVTIMGLMNSDRIGPYSVEEYGTLFRIFDGTKENAVGQLHKEFLLKLWGFRGLGLFLMWMGLSLMLGPLTVVMDVLPIAGAIGRAVVGFVTFVISLVLSSIAILVSMALHSLTALIVVFAAGIVLAIITFLVFKHKSAKLKRT
ncbi:MAG: TMEM43 family protein [bacterium]